MPNLIGPDVSFYQDDNATERMIDFAKMKSNAGYVIIRSGQNLWADPDFKLNWQAAKGVLPRGSYWFYDSRVEPKRQADLWVSLFAGDLGELPLFCDFEDNYGGAYGRWQDWYTFIERLKTLVPSKEIGIYTAYYYWLERTVVKGIPAASLEYFKQYPLWVANYGVDKPLVPKPWTEWTFWQYTDAGDGAAYGVESKEIDLNYFNGDLAEFRKRFQLGNIPPEPEPPTGAKMYQMTTISSGTRIRSDHNVYAGVLTSIASNIMVTGSEMWTAPADGNNVKAGDQWMKITYAGVTGWMALTHMGIAICKDFKVINEYEPDPTPPEKVKIVSLTVVSHYADGSSETEDFVPVV